MNALILDCSYGMNVFVISDENLYFQIDRNQKKHTDELLVSVNKLLERRMIIWQKVMAEKHLEK